jgi:RND family efflux transporter MFP subunit
MQRRLAIGAAAIVLFAGGSVAVAHGVSRGAAHVASRTAVVDPIRETRRVAPEPKHAATMVGVVLAERTADVAPPYAGRLRAVNARLGEHVAEGAVMASMDVAVTRFDVPKARAALQSLRIDEQRAAIELTEQMSRHGRKQRLFDAQLVSEEEVESARYQEQGARLHVEGLRAERVARAAEVARLEQVHAEADVRAPFAGVVALRYVDPGASVSTQTPIVRIVGDGPRFVRFAAPAGSASRARIGESVFVRTPSAILRCTIARVAPEVDAASRTIAMEAMLSSSDDAPALVGEMVEVTLDEMTP